MDSCQDVKIVSGDCSDAFQLMQFTGRSDTVRVDLYYEPTALSPLFDGAGATNISPTNQPANQLVNPAEESLTRSGPVRNNPSEL